MKQSRGPNLGSKQNKIMVSSENFEFLFEFGLTKKILDLINLFSVKAKDSVS